ncbi:hypothetical protein J6397_30400 [Rhodococcus qingshengii]|uniref:hypothetical protein n=1 Tax=Rhodococcus qingshengii TaxID=334542 RepID=UPI001AE7F595|nr:hypothetical protein [Rhodococcus qingshengii]MBP1054458.1 hypothetical protein [Rhodococcus qingshengii]
MQAYTKYASLRVEDLPYPDGLGKEEHKGIQAAVKNLLGADALDPEVHEAHFWTGPYQAAVAEHLAPIFAEDGDIVDIARRGLEIAEANPAFGVAIPGGGLEHIEIFAANLPPKPVSNKSEGQQYAWAGEPPLLFSEDGHLTILDGRHRLSYLRSKVQKSDPDFPVLVRIQWEGP